jgi:anion-transporting  ArsA/GET3 family ATPase
VNLLDRLAGLKLLVVTGKGGVGKSTIAAALGKLLARARRRVLLLEIDPRESLYPLLDVPPSGGAFARVAEGLYLQNLSPRSVLDEVVREQIGIELIARRLLAGPIYRHFAEAAPGLKELAALGHALRVVQGRAGAGAPEVDLVVLDAPATGHGVSMLAAPGLVSDVIREGPFGRMGAELAGFVEDPATCGVVVATLAEEMPVQEAIELIGLMAERLDRRPELVAVNAVYPDRGGAGPVASDPAIELWTRRRQVNDRELARLGRHWHGPRLELPLLPLERGPALADALGDVLRSGLEGQAPWS